MPNPIKAIHASYNLLSWAMDHDQVPNDIRRSLELVRTCDADLQHLIELRNDCLPLLQRRPKVLHRVHCIIESAQKGLAEVCEIVERCRPETNRGTRTRFSKRMAWVLVDSSEFKSQEPIVSRHHAAVLAELNFLRQVALMAPVFEPEKVQERCGVQRDLPVFDSVALLGDMLGDLTMTSPLKEQPRATHSIMSSPPSIILSNKTQSATPSTVSSLQLPSSLHRPLSSQTLHIEHTAESLPEVLPVNMASTAPSRSLTTRSKCDSEDLAGLALLLGDPLDMKDILSPSPPSDMDALDRPTIASSHTLPTGPPRLYSAYNISNPSLPHSTAEDSVSDLSHYGRHASLGYTPSNLSHNISNPLHHRHSSMSVLSTTTRTLNQYSVPSAAYPGQLAWSNSSSTTVSSISPGFSAYEPALVQPIAELDTSPYQMVPLAGLLDQTDPDRNSSTGQKSVVQVNTMPVELPAEDTQAANSGPRRRTIPLDSRRRKSAYTQSFFIG
ncbi:hypothetical protein DER45DRAFT_329866 [Fusarium avenaceum]|nr:hypothetical protein DER45DRAFT_329866 [Fusarium avenaceum]